MEKLGQKGRNHTDKMLVNVRCWSCGKPVGHLWEEYKERSEKGEERKAVMDELGLERYC